MGVRQIPKDHYRAMVRLFKEKEKDHSLDGKLLPLGFTKFNIRDAKYVRVSRTVGK